MSDDIDLTDDEYDTFITVLAEERCQHSHADTACPPPPERAILRDLIEELRDRHADCTTCCYTKRTLDCAEARLAGARVESQAKAHRDLSPRALLGMSLRHRRV